MSKTERIAFEADLITANNENLEEAEELEDRKRREQEIQNLLTHAMGEFNYDEQSTVNSSVVSNEGEESVNQQNALEQQYLEANLDEQLRVLYDVRVREILALNKDLECLKREFQKKEQILKKKIVLLEIENERKNISLREAQGLLVEKMEQNTNLEGEIQSMHSKMKSLESNLDELNQGNAMLQEANMKLEQQLVIMERGFPLQNKVNDKELLESQRIRISQLEENLEKAIDQNECKEQRYKKAICELQQNLHEKINGLAEQGRFITELTNNLDFAKNQCSKLSKSLEELRQSRKVTNHSGGSLLEEELRRIREQNERLDILSKNIKQKISEEYQDEIAKLTTENERLKQECRELEQQLQTLNSVCKGKNILEDKLNFLQNEKIILQNDLKELQNQDDFTTKERDYFKERHCDLTDKLRDLQNENSVLYQKLLDFDSAISSTKEVSIQTSFFSENNNELINLLQKEKEDFKNKLEVAVQENSQLKIKLGLEEQRDALIKELQEKALQFNELILKNKRESIETKTISTGVNTELIEGEAILKIKYDTFMYQTETNLRLKLKQEFDKKLEKFMKEADRQQTCKSCKSLTDENKRLNELRKHDRLLVADMADEWFSKFQHLQKDMELKVVELEACHRKRLAEHEDKLKKEYKIAYKLSIESLLMNNIKENTFLNERFNKIMKSISQGTRQIAEIERECSQKKAVSSCKKNMTVIKY